MEEFVAVISFELGKRVPQIVPWGETFKVNKIKLSYFFKFIL
jgi:hypothetical protein